MRAGVNIVLCGFMGCGKTTVGRLLAQMSGRSFVDMDEYIETAQGRSISDIFRADGEAAFRAAEREACRDLSRRTGLVIATGGGALVDRRNAVLLSQTGVVVLLEVPLPVLSERLKGDKNRPLLQRADREEAMQSLYEARLPCYRRAARFWVDASRAPRDVCREILQKLGAAPDNAL